MNPPGMTKRKAFRMRIGLVIAAGAVALAFAGSAQASFGGCVGAPPDYVAAFDTVRGQSQNGQVDYFEHRIFIEIQGWLTPADGVSVPDHGSEHLHTGMCVPLNETIITRALDIRYSFHNVTDYTVRQPTGAIVDSRGNVGDITWTPAQLAELNAAALASAGHNTTTNVYQTYALPPAQNNGIKEFRFGIDVERANANALVDRWFTDGRVYFIQDEPGLSEVPYVTADGPPFVRMRNWIFTNAIGAQYFYAGFGESLLGSPTWGEWRASQLRPPRPADWRVVFRSTDGATNGGMQIDPNHHVHPDFNGIWNWYIGAHASDTNYPVTIPLGSLNLEPGSWHKLFLFADQNPDSPNPVNKPLSRSVVVLPFEAPRAAADTQAPSTPTGLAKSGPQPSSVVFSWNASSDNVGVTGYNVYRDGLLYSTVTGTSATVAGLSAASHLLEVSAVDAAGNLSPRAGVTATRTWQ
jgi:hypothetical protein